MEPIKRLGLPNSILYPCLNCRYTKSLANERGNSLASSTSSRSPATGCNQTTAQPQFDSNGNPLTPRGYHQLAPRYEDVPRDFTPSTSGLGMPEPQYQVRNREFTRKGTQFRLFFTTSFTFYIPRSVSLFLGSSCGSD